MCICVTEYVDCRCTCVCVCVYAAYLFVLKRSICGVEQRKLNQWTLNKNGQIKNDNDDNQIPIKTSEGKRKRIERMGKDYWEQERWVIRKTLKIWKDNV